MTNLFVSLGRVRLVLLFFMPAALLPTGCNEPAAGPAAQAQESTQATPKVTTTKPARRTISRKIEQPGEIQAYEQTPIHTKISGYVKKVYKDIGDNVAEGELLAELAVPEMDEELAQKKALVLQAQAEVEQAKRLFAAAQADVKSAAAKVKETEAGRLRANAERQRAESQYERLKKSAAVLTQDVLDETRLGLEAAKAVEAEVEAKIGSSQAGQLSAEARRDKAHSDIQLAEAHQRVAEADERRVAALLSYAKLRAPFPGIVTRRNVDTGHFLQPGANLGERSAVFVVSRIDPVRIFVDVPEADAVFVGAGTAAVVSIQALRGEKFIGEVKRTAWSLDARARTLRTEIELKNPEGKLRPGMYAYSVLTVSRENALALPLGALVTQGDQTYCYMLEGGKAARTPVRVGFRDTEFVEVLKKQTRGQPERWEDLTGADDVIISNPTALTDSQAVTVSESR